MSVKLTSKCAVKFTDLDFIILELFHKSNSTLERVYAIPRNIPYSLMNIFASVKSKSIKISPLPTLVHLLTISFQVMLIGDSGVGKTCVLVRFKDGAFLSGSFISTVGIDFKVSPISCFSIRIQD